MTCLLSSPCLGGWGTVLCLFAFDLHASDLDEFKVKRQEVFEFT